jgi:hypothetical protein
MMQPHEVAQSAQGERRPKNQKAKVVDAGQLILCVEEHEGNETHETECHQAQSPGYPSWVLRFVIGFHQDVLACMRRLPGHLI